MKRFMAYMAGGLCVLVFLLLFNANVTASKREMGVTYGPPFLTYKSERALIKQVLEAQVEILKRLEELRFILSETR